MNKRLILVLALALVAGLTMAAYAEVQNVKVSGDMSVMGISRKFNLQSNVKTDSVGNTGSRGTKNAIASITRVRVDADLTDNVATTVRLLNERYWGTENANTSSNGDSNTNIDLDLAYATMKEFLYSPLTLTVGRQELHFGNDMIVGDPDTNNAASASSPFGNAVGVTRRDADLSARKAFDAIRATLNYDPLVIDGVAAKISEANLSNKDDQDLLGINVGYDLNKKTKLEGYWFEKRTSRDASGAKKVGRTDTFGGRVVLAPIENLVYQLEGAYQIGKVAGTSGQPSPNRQAYALETSVSYDWKKAKWTPSSTLMYAYFSGEEKNNYDTNQGAFHGWDPMFENQTSGHIANALFNQTGVQLVGASLSLKPKDDVTLKGEYYVYWWTARFGDLQPVTTVYDTGTTLLMTDKAFAGQEIDGTVTYDYTEDVQFSLLGGLFLPGSSFEKTNDAFASEVIGSMKVTF